MLLMKKHLPTVLILFVASIAIGQTNVTDMPTKMLTSNWREWQLDGVTLIFVLGILGRAVKALQSGGGIIGAIKGVLYGVNTPTPPTPTP